MASFPARKDAIVFFRNHRLFMQLHFDWSQYSSTFCVCQARISRSIGLFLLTLACFQVRLCLFHAHLQDVWRSGKGLHILKINMAGLFLQLSDCPYSQRHFAPATWPADCQESFRTAENLGYRLFSEIITDVIMETESEHKFWGLDGKEFQEVKKRSSPFLKMPPEYSYICNSVLSVPSWFAGGRRLKPDFRWFARWDHSS